MANYIVYIFRFYSFFTLIFAVYYLSVCQIYALAYGVYNSNLKLQCKLTDWWPNVINLMHHSDHPKFFDEIHYPIPESDIFSEW